MESCFDCVSPALAVLVPELTPPLATSAPAVAVPAEMKWRRLSEFLAGIAEVLELKCGSWGGKLQQTCLRKTKPIVASEETSEKNRAERKFVAVGNANSPYDCPHQVRQEETNE